MSQLRAALGRIVFLVGLLLGSSATAEVLPVWLSTGSGFLISGRDTCVVVTAAHVIGDSLEFYYVGPSGMNTARVRWTNRVADVAIAVPGRAENGCPALPSRDEVGRGLDQAVGGIMTRNETGAQPVTNVVLSNRGSGQEFTVRAANGAVMQGLSGAPVVFGGMVVGVQRSYGEFGSSVLRLDYLSEMEGARDLLYAGTRRLDSATLDRAVMLGYEGFRYCLGKTGPRNIDFNIGAVESNLAAVLGELGLRVSYQGMACRPIANRTDLFLALNDAVDRNLSAPHKQAFDVGYSLAEAQYEAFFESQKLRGAPRSSEWEVTYGYDDERWNWESLAETFESYCLKFEQPEDGDAAVANATASGVYGRYRDLIEYFRTNRGEGRRCKTSEDDFYELLKAQTPK